MWTQNILWNLFAVLLSLKQRTCSLLLLHHRAKGLHTAAPKYLEDRSPLGIRSFYESPSLVLPAALMEIMTNTPAGSLALAWDRTKRQSPQNGSTARHNGFKWGLSQQQKGNASLWYWEGFVHKLEKGSRRQRPLDHVLSPVSDAETFFLTRSEVCEPVSSGIGACKANARPQWANVSIF